MDTIPAHPAARAAAPVVAKAVALAVAITIGSIHLVATWGTIAMVIDLLWMPPLVGMAFLLVWDSTHKHQAAGARRS